MRKRYQYSVPCPLCHGNGKIIKLSVFSPEQRKKARLLYAKGTTFAEIGKVIGIKHRQSVKTMIFSKTF